MRKLTFIALLIGLMAMGACASSKPCPAYAKADLNKEIKG